MSLRLHPTPSPSSCVTPAENQFSVLLAFSLIVFLYSQAAWLGVSAAAFHSVSLPCSLLFLFILCNLTYLLKNGLSALFLLESVSVLSVIDYVNSHTLVGQLPVMTFSDQV